MATSTPSTSANTAPAASIQATGGSNGANSRWSKKSRHRSRTKPTNATSGNPSLSESTVNPSTALAGSFEKSSGQTQIQGRSRSDFPWRGSGRGRGRGGSSVNGGGGRGGSAAATGGRAFSTVPSPSSGGTSSADDAGSRVPFARPGQAGGGGAWRRQPLHTDSAPSSAGNASAAELTPPVPVTDAAGPSNGAGQGKKRKGKEPNRAEAVLREASLKEGEEGGLAVEMMRLYEIQRPSPSAIAAREHLISELTSWLNSENFRWGHPHSPYKKPLVIEPFGSIRFGLGTSTSDLDLCLLDPYRPNGFVDKFFSSSEMMYKELPDVYNMRRLGRSLQNANLQEVRSIPDASVPICKFKVMIDGHLIEADLNTNERLGVFNSRLINSYCNLHPLVRPLSVFIKFWAKQRGLNDPAGSPTTFSSYTYILLIIQYLQTLQLLPNLQSTRLISETNTPQTRFFSTPKGRSKRYRKIVRSVGWDVTFVEYEEPPQGYEPEQADLVDLARGFFKYYSQDFDMRTEIVSIWNGSPLPRAMEYGQLAQSRREADRKRTEEMKRKMGLLDSEEGLGEMSAEEETRQDEEDDFVKAFAETDLEDSLPNTLPAASSPSPDTPLPDLGVADATSDASAQQQQQEEQARTPPARPDSRSSEPMEYAEYAEPERWSEHALVVQDPFILTRNCAGNVHEDWVEELRVQMARALSLIESNAPLSTICANVKAEVGYQSVMDMRRREKRKEGPSRRERDRLRKEKKQLAAAVTPATVDAKLVDVGRQEEEVGERAEADERAEAGKDEGNRENGDSTPLAVAPAVTLATQEEAQ